MVRRVLKDNRSLGPERGPGQLRPLAGATGSAARFLGKRQAGLFERPGACLEPGA